MLSIARRGSLAAVAIVLAHAAPLAAQPSGPDGNLPLPAPEIERRLRDDPFTIAAVKETTGGIMTTYKLTLVFADGQRIDAKWKAAADGGEGWNNSPRRELAAYRVQQLYLDPDDYLVPPSVVRCIPLDDYRAIDPEAEPNLPHARCVYGTLSAWLDNVHQPEETWTPERFKQDPRFAYHFANLNILTYLIAHRDRRRANFLLADDPLNPQMFSIDNGIILGGEVYNFFSWHFDEIVVASLPARSIERLRRVTPAELAKLTVLAELQPDLEGVLGPAWKQSAVADPTQGQRAVGEGIQIGLTSDELADISGRLRELLRKVDTGEEKTF